MKMATGNRLTWLIALILSFFTHAVVTSQSVGINGDGSSPDASALLDIKSTDKGVLIPRTDTASVNAASTPVQGLLIYQVSDDRFYYYDGSFWQALLSTPDRAFEDAGTVIRQTGDFNGNDFIFGKSELPGGSPVGIGDFFFFDQSKAAFRSGRMFSSTSWAPDSIGLMSFAHGYNPKALGVSSVAFGESTEALGSHSFAGGWNSVAIGSLSFAYGLDIIASGDRAVAMGDGNTASGFASFAVGRDNMASGNRATAMGNATEASNFASFAIGDETLASGSKSTAMGEETLARGTASLALGYRTNADSYVSVAIGRYNVGGGGFQGWWSTSDELFEVGIGSSDVNRENAFTIMKNGEVSFKNYTLPLSDGTPDQALVTNGSGTISWSFASQFEKINETIRLRDATNGDIDFLFGRNQLPTSSPITDNFLFYDQIKSALRVGILNISTAWSPDSVGICSFGFGKNVSATGSYSLALGSGTNAQGTASVAFGSGSSAVGANAFAGGNASLATGNSSVAMGSSNVASSFCSVALGNFTVASGNSATALGYSTTAAGNIATSLGLFTSAQAYTSTAIGRYNKGGGSYWAWVETDPLFEIGIGTSPGSRNNAFTVLKNGMVGIGTNQPSSSLEIAGTDNTNALMIDNGKVRLRHHFDLISTDRDFMFFLLDADSSQENTVFALFKDVTSSIGTVPVVKFGLDNQKSWYNGGGFFGFGTTNPIHPLHMGSGAHVTAGGLWIGASDISKKMEIRDLDYGLSHVLAMQPKRYVYKADSSRSIGFIAQEMEMVIPESVSGEEGEKGIAYGILTSVLVNAIKEQQVQLDQKQLQIDAMEARLLALEKLMIETQPQDPVSTTQTTAHQAKLTDNPEQGIKK